MELEEDAILNECRRDGVISFVGILSRSVV